MMEKIAIKHRWNGSILFSGEFANLKKATEEAVNTGANLRGANLYGANLCGADLRGADLCGADLRGADLRVANLYGANLRVADLRGADLCGADLRGADLRVADLRVADLRGANLRVANLRVADLCGANLRVADLRGADLYGADLRGAENYSESHDFFFELVRKEKVEAFNQEQWAIIGQLSIHRLCWDSIQKRFGDTILPIFTILASKGFDEYLKRYKEMLEAE